MREQAGWDEHARFMDDLVDAGFVVLGGPLEGDREVLLIVEAESEDAIRVRLAGDPWASNGMLRPVSIERWTLLLDGRGESVRPVNPVFEAARTVLAVREFQDKPIPADVLHRIVDSAHLSASSVNLQPWHFVVVTSREQLQELGRLIKTGRYVAGAAAAVVVAYEKDSGYGVSDASRAIQSMILTAWGEGVGSSWTGFGGMEDVRKSVALPDGYDVLAVVPFGYPKRALGKGQKKRKPMAEVVSAERFGTPLT